MQVAVFHPGTQHSWQTALALQNLDRLAWFATTMFHRPDAWPFYLADRLPGPIGAAARREFQRVRFDALDPALVWTFGWHEWAERLARRGGHARLAAAIDRRGNEVFASRVAEIAQGGDLALWGYNKCSAAAFRGARAAARILDRTTPHLRAINAILGELEDSHGDWVGDRGSRHGEPAIAIEDEEHELADRIVVGSEFSRASMLEHADASVERKLRLLPYCFDEALFADAPPPRPIVPGGPVKFLFVGTVSARKGAHLAIEAVARVPRSAAELTLVGHMRLPQSKLAAHSDRFTHIPQVARSAVPRIMAEHHVLVFPSFFEGGGIVLYEALAAGLALIQTPRASHAVTPQTGILLDRLDVDTLEQAMAACIADRARLAAWRAAAPGRARAFTFARYRDGVENIVAELETAAG